MNKRLRISAILVASGLLIELITLMWSHPLSFILFMSVGAVLLAAGILFFLYSLTLQGRLPSENEKTG
jgi:hypothetical protein